MFKKKCNLIYPCWFRSEVFSSFFIQSSTLSLYFQHDCSYTMCTPTYTLNIYVVEIHHVQQVFHLQQLVFRSLQFDICLR